MSMTTEQAFWLGFMLCSVFNIGLGIWIIKKGRNENGK